MQNALKAAFGLALTGLLASTANAQTVVQNNPINIAAVVTIGGPPASVTQNGQYNYAGVVQSGVNTSASIRQTGTAVNAGFIGQAGATASGSIVQGGGPRVYNSAAIGQSTYTRNPVFFRRR